MPPETPYFDRMLALTRQLNKWRCDPAQLSDYTTSWTGLRIDPTADYSRGFPLMRNQYVCLDDLDTLSGTQDIRYCSHRGMFQNGVNVLPYLSTDLAAYAAGPALHEFQWSNALALSASRLLKDMEGCSLIPDQIWNDQTTHWYIDAIAEYDDHRRIAFYPDKFSWSDLEEQIFDLILDDRTVGFPNRMWLMNNHFDSIGIACNCDPVFGEMCIAELGKNIRLKKPLALNYDREPEETPSFDSRSNFSPRPGNCDLDCQPEMPDYGYCLVAEANDCRRNLEPEKDMPFVVPEFRPPHDP